MKPAPDSVARGTLVNLATRLAGVAAVLAITALVARISPAAQGAFALVTSVEGVVLALLSGFGVALARHLSQRGAPPPGWVSAMVGACVALGLGLAAVLAAVSLWGPPAYGWLWLLALALPLLLLTPNLSGLWLGQGRMVPMARATLAAPVLALALLLAAAVAGWRGVGVAVAAWVIAKAAVALVLLWRFRRAGHIGAPAWAALRADAGFIATIGLTNLVGLLNYRVGLFVVERLLGVAATGVYSIAVVVAELLWFVSGSLTQAVYGRIGTPDAARAAATTVRVLHLGLAALAVVAPLLLAAAWLLLPVLLGEAYRASLVPLALLLPGALLFGGAGSLSAWFTNHAGRPQVPARVAAASLVLNAALALLLVPQLGLAGAALAASAGYTLGVGLLLVMFVRASGLPVRALWPGAAFRADVARVLALRR